MKVTVKFDFRRYGEVPERLQLLICTMSREDPSGPSKFAREGIATNFLPTNLNSM